MAKKTKKNWLIIFGVILVLIIILFLIKNSDYKIVNYQNNTQQYQLFKQQKALIYIDNFEEFQRNPESFIGKNVTAYGKVSYSSIGEMYIDNDANRLVDNDGFWLVFIPKIDRVWEYHTDKKYTINGIIKSKKINSYVNNNTYYYLEEN